MNLRTLFAAGAPAAATIALVGIALAAPSSPAAPLPASSVLCWKYQTGSTWHLSLSPQSTTVNVPATCQLTVSRLSPNYLSRYREVIRAGSLSASYVAVPCYPLSAAGNCYQRGQFCPLSEHDHQGLSGDGRVITCTWRNGWRWE